MTWVNVNPDICHHMILLGHSEWMTQNHSVSNDWSIVLYYCVVLEWLNNKKMNWYIHNRKLSLIARFMGPTWGPPGADRTQEGPMLAPWIWLSGVLINNVPQLTQVYTNYEVLRYKHHFRNRNVVVRRSFYLTCISFTSFRLCWLMTQYMYTPPVGIGSGNDLSAPWIHNLPEGCLLIGSTEPGALLS